MHPDASRREKEREAAEKLNEEECVRLGALVECACCYLDVPSNRAIPCEGDEVHFFCYDCIRRSAETEIGLMKYRLACFDTSGCNAGFSRVHLEQAIGGRILNKLDSLQQQDEIAKADLDGLEECPFCEFKAICPPVEEDREFVCRNLDCEIVSCRLCKLESHIPMTCDESRREKGISDRHLVEEAMSQALIRKCPKCSVNIVKEYGCNKMVCPQCRCVMCYVCKKNITGQNYNHFSAGPNRCPLHDCRVENEVNKAQDDAIEKIQAEKPDMRREDLIVEKLDNSKRQRADGHVNPLHRGALPPGYTQMNATHMPYPAIRHQPPVAPVAYPYAPGGVPGGLFAPQRYYIERGLLGPGAAHPYRPQLPAPRPVIGQQHYARPYPPTPGALNRPAVHPPPAPQLQPQRHRYETYYRR